MKRLAFTLAEVLITLTVIGVIAAMTVSTLVSKYQKQTYVVGLKRSYSELSNAIIMMPVRMGCPAGDFVCAGLFKNDAGDVNASDAMNLFAEQMKVVKSCSAWKKGCGPDKYSIYIGGDSGVSYAYPYTRFVDFPSILTASGVAYAFFTGLFSGEVPNLGIYVDINNQKGPNRQGRDIFLFIIARQDHNGIKQGTLMPMGSELYSKYQGQGSYRGTWKNGNYPCLKQKSVGSYCAGRVLEENAMNY